ncbi:MoxR-like ATPase [Actinophytocola algeriensis]|uniref:MoxR-like ATPase n=1 Tax=Actinophytocola algeriensis TaxID=1768010 RepID=A0A7W7PZF6_9PSEU|nr:MoxR-like ATPase [Actinophytocola algeriensis]MBE1476978.1 MoxR-like ATPase [Actinophytocola algeriensis]
MDDYEAERRLGAEFHLTAEDVDPREIDMVNASLFLRRPLLVTGKPGSGKSALAYRVSRELRLGRVLRWSVTSRTTLQSGQYEYDAIGRAQAAATSYAAARRAETNGSTDVEEPAIGDFIRLGPLGTAFLPTRTPRVLLIDELDKSDADLPNDLLSIFEDAEFGIPELERIRAHTSTVRVFTSDRNGSATLTDGRVACAAFPVIIITSNGEREFPAAFLRRCLRLEMREPDANQLAAMVANHMLDQDGVHSDRLIREFVARSAELDGLPADKLLEAVYLATSGAFRENGQSWPRLLDALWRRLSLAP